MNEFDEIELSRASPVLPGVARLFRRRIRAGFALCAAALGSVLAYEVAVISATLVAPPLDTNREVNSATWKLSTQAVEGAAMGILIAGLVLLYRVPHGQRWRLASTLLLAMSGVDVALFTLRTAGGDAIVMALCAFFAMALSWVELWMLAVLAAEAAESAERPDLTYQTEVIGKLVIWGAFTWLLAMVWSFDLVQLQAPSAAAVPHDVFEVIVYHAAVVLHLMVLARTIFCLVGLINAYAPARTSQS